MSPSHVAITASIAASFEKLSVGVRVISRSLWSYDPTWRFGRIFGFPRYSQTELALIFMTRAMCSRFGSDADLLSGSLALLLSFFEGAFEEGTEPGTRA